MKQIDNSNRLDVLLGKQLADESTNEEKLELSKFIEQSDDDAVMNALQQQWADYHPKHHMSDEQSQKVLSSILSPMRLSHSSKRKTLHFYIRTISIAAAVVIAVAAGIYLYDNNQSQSPDNVLTEVTAVPMSQSVGYTRHLVLSDGSTVILRAGSRLICPSHFSGNKREVHLEGEAYFDIVHNPSMQFVIHSGKVNTTVLGTAFNIKSEAGNVTVSVTRGRVKVDNGKRILAVLTVNEELHYKSDDTYTTNANTAVQNKVEQWTRQEMFFNHQTLSEVAQVLSRRYGMQITIADKQLAKMIFVSSFNGTESLHEILDVLCSLTPNITYEIRGNEITILKKADE
jgi:transmembrane sensor